MGLVALWVLLVTTLVCSQKLASLDFDDDSSFLTVFSLATEGEQNDLVRPRPSPGPGPRPPRPPPRDECGQWGDWQQVKCFWPNVTLDSLPDACTHIPVNSRWPEYFKKFVTAKAQEMYNVIADDYKARGAPPKCGFCARSFECRKRDQMLPPQRHCPLKEIRPMHESCDDSLACEITVEKGGCPPPLFLRGKGLEKINDMIKSGDNKGVAAELFNIRNKGPSRRSKRQAGFWNSEDDMGSRFERPDDNRNSFGPLYNENNGRSGRNEDPNGSNFGSRPIDDDQFQGRRGPSPDDSEDGRRGPPRRGGPRPDFPEDDQFGPRRGSGDRTDRRGRPDEDDRRGPRRDNDGPPRRRGLRPDFPEDDQFDPRRESGDRPDRRGRPDEDDRRGPRRDNNGPPRRRGPRPDFPEDDQFGPRRGTGDRPDRRGRPDEDDRRGPRRDNNGPPRRRGPRPDFPEDNQFGLQREDDGRPDVRSKRGPLGPERRNAEDDQNDNRENRIGPSERRPPGGRRPFRPREDERYDPRDRRPFRPPGRRPPFRPREDFRPRRDDRRPFGPPGRRHPFRPRDDESYNPRDRRPFGPPEGRHPFGPRGDSRPRRDERRPFGPPGGRHPFRPREDDRFDPRGPRNDDQSSFGPQDDDFFGPAQRRSPSASSPSDRKRGDRPFGSFGQTTDMRKGLFGPGKGENLQEKPEDENKSPLKFSQFDFTFREQEEKENRRDHETEHLAELVHGTTCVSTNDSCLCCCGHYIPNVDTGACENLLRLLPGLDTVLDSLIKGNQENVGPKKNVAPKPNSLRTNRTTPERNIINLRGNNNINDNTRKSSPVQRNPFVLKKDNIIDF